MRFSLTQGKDPRSTLIVDTCSRIDEPTIARFKHFLYMNGCANGILFDPQDCVILRDTFMELSDSSFEVTPGPRTEELLSTVGDRETGSLHTRVARWLRMLSTQWDSAIPKSSNAAAQLLYDIVPAASGATIHEWAPAA